MKETVHLILLLSFPFLLSAQEALSFSPIEVEETFVVDLSNSNLDLELYSTVRNNTADTLMLKWERVVIDQPTDWNTQVCDKNFCFSEDISSNYNDITGVKQPVLLAPEDTFKLIFHVLPKGIAGVGTFELPFSRIGGDNELLNTVTFKATIESNATTSTTNFIDRRISIYPNPAVEYFQLSSTQGVDEVVVYSLLGKKVKTFSTYGVQRFDVSDISDGLYLVSLISAQSGVVRTVRLSKRSFRP